MELYLSPIKKALDSLIELLARPETESDLGLRDGAIQRFEYTFELSWKLMQKVLDLEHDPESTPSYSKRDLLRTIAKRNLISDAGPWFHFLDARNQTVHGYDNKQADAVFIQVNKTQISLIKSILQNTFGCTDVWIYGSRARGSAKKNSDVDIIIKGAK